MAMKKRCFGFYNEDGEQELTMDLNSDQMELLSFLQDYGYLCDSVHIQDLGEVCNYPPYHNCPECGKTLILLNGIGHEAEYWCDDCGLDTVIDVNELEDMEYGN